LPAIYSVLTSKFGLNAAVKDLIVTRGSTFFNIFGALFIAISPAPGLLIIGMHRSSLPFFSFLSIPLLLTYPFIAIIFYSFGNGSSSAARSLITALVRPDQVSRLYAVVAVLDTIGSLVSGPMLSEAYSWGLHIGGLWSGMAFILIALLYSVTCLPIFLFKLPEVEVEDD
jgi:hypothetical protein